MEEEVKKEASEAQEEGKEKEKEELGKSLDKMTAKELREIAIEIPGVAGVHAMKKEELLRIIKEAKGIKDEGPARKRRLKGPKTEVNIGELKKKIGLLKEEKTKVRAEKDRKKIDTLRRRIGRLKKKIRKIPPA